MESVECLKWIKDNNLYDISYKASQILKKVIPTCLAPKDEKILIVGDTGSDGRCVSAVLSCAYYLATEQLKLDSKLIFQSPKTRGDDADSNVITSLSELKQGNIIILNMSDKLGGISELGKSFRKWSKKKQHRFVSAMSLGDLKTEKIEMITDAIDIPYRAMQNQHDELKRKIDGAKEIRVTTSAGTDFVYGIDGISSIKADGNYVDDGTGGNLPAGEIYLPPYGKSVNGRIIIDGSSRTHEHTILIKEPIELIVEEGNIVKINGGDEAKQLSKTIEWAASTAKNPGNVRRICELGIGLNPKAKIIGAMIVDDKSLGTAHVGIGSNYWFGGSIYATIHLDQVFRDPKIYIDGQLLKL